MLIKSPEALLYEQFFGRQVPGWACKGLSGKLCLEAKIYYANVQSDLSDELLCDLLQATGIIQNDRDIYRKVLEKEIDKTNPRVELKIFIM